MLNPNEKTADISNNTSQSDKPQGRRKFKTIEIKDEQTGKIFILKHEKGGDIFAAGVSFAYSLAAIVYLGWLLLDIWLAQYEFWFLRPYKASLLLHNSGIFKLVAYTAIGGGIGAAANNIRSYIQWHAELEAFGWRFVGKYIAMPPLGATLAVMVYAIIRGGIAAFNGNLNATDINAMSLFAAWATGALTGYGSHKVFIWLDDKVNNLFKVTDKSTEANKVKAPNLIGKSRAEAEQLLKAVNLSLGEVNEVPVKDKNSIGKIVDQNPKADTEIATSNKVAISIGKVGGEQGLPANQGKTPDLKGMTQEEAEQLLNKVSLALGDIKKVTVNEQNSIDKVVDQDPKAGTEIPPKSKVTISIGKES